MPHINGKLVTADEAVAAGLCPACTQRLTQDNKAGHAELHYPVKDPNEPSNAEALRHKKLILSFTG